MQRWHRAGRLRRNVDLLRAIDKGRGAASMSGPGSCDVVVIAGRKRPSAPLRSEFTVWGIDGLINARGGKNAGDNKRICVRRSSMERVATGPRSTSRTIVATQISRV